MPSLKTAIIILPLLTHLAAAQVPEGLAYSGQTSWDAATGIVTFKSSGTMPEENEALWWQVPSQVKRIVIEPNVTVRGGFRVPLRTPENPLHIVGGDRKSSVIFGTDSEPAQCALNLTVTGAEIGRLEPGIRRTRGTITINGRALP